MGFCSKSVGIVTLVLFPFQCVGIIRFAPCRVVKVASPSMTTVLGRPVPPRSRKTFLSFAVGSTVFRLTLPTYHTNPAGAACFLCETEF